MKKTLIGLMIVFLLSGCNSKKIKNKEADKQIKNEKIQENTLENKNLEGPFLQKDENLDDFLKNKKPSLFVLTSDYCTYCKIYDPIVIKAFEKYKDKINIRIVNIERDFNFAQNFEVGATPSSMIFDKDGKAYKLNKKLEAQIGGNIVYIGDKKNPKKTVLMGAIPENILEEILKDILDAR